MERENWVPRLFLVHYYSSLLFLLLQDPTIFPHISNQTKKIQLLLTVIKLIMFSVHV